MVLHRFHMFSTIPDKASKDLTRFMLTCGTDITGNGASCMSFSRAVCACNTICCACSKVTWVLCIACIAVSPASTARRNLPSPGLSSVPGVGLASSPPSPSAPLLPRCRYKFWTSPMFLPAPAAVGPAQELGLPLSVCPLVAEHLWRTLHPAVAKPLSATTRVVLRGLLLRTHAASVPIQKRPGLASCALPL